MFFTSDALFRGIRELADRHGTPVAFHIASSREEAALSESRTGKWPVGHLDDIDVLREDMLPARFDEREVIDGAREAAARIASRLGLDPRPRWPLVESDDAPMSLT